MGVFPSDQQVVEKVQIDNELLNRVMGLMD